MPQKRNRADDFMVVDEFHRDLHFYVDKGEYYRENLSPTFQSDTEPRVKKVSKMVYAMLWLDLCLKEG